MQVRGLLGEPPLTGGANIPTERLGPRLSLPVPGAHHRRRHAAPPGPGVPPRAGITCPQRLRPLLGTHSVCRLLTRAARIRSHPARAAVRMEAFQEKGLRKEPATNTRGPAGLSRSPRGSRGACPSLSELTRLPSSGMSLDKNTHSQCHRARPPVGLRAAGQRADRHGRAAGLLGFPGWTPRDPAPSTYPCWVWAVDRDGFPSGPAHPLGPLNAQGHRTAHTNAPPAPEWLSHWGPWAPRNRAAVRGGMAVPGETWGGFLEGEASELGLSLWFWAAGL